VQYIFGDGPAQSVQRRATGWGAGIRFPAVARDPVNGFIKVCHFKSHMKSYLHSLINFLPFPLNHLGLPSPVLDQILLLLDYSSLLLLRRVFSVPL
jgi:hypothetical protein